MSVFYNWIGQIFGVDLYIEASVSEEDKERLVKFLTKKILGKELKETS